jgi:hypothetical protein
MDILAFVLAGGRVAFNHFPSKGDHMSKLPLVAFIFGLTVSLADPIIVRAATAGGPIDADQPQNVPEPKDGLKQRPVTTPKRTAGIPMDADQPQNVPQSKDGLRQRPVTTPKREVSTPKDADQPQNEPPTKRER